jgi:hypothetical protein
MPITSNISEEEANLALSQFTDAFIEEKSIEYILVLKSMVSFFTKHTYYLEVGKIEKLQNNRNLIVSDKEKTIPKEFEFKIWKKDGQSSKDQGFETKKIKVKQNLTSKTTIDVSNFDSDISVSNRFGTDFGTCGAIFKLESFASYFGISNWHVLQHETGKLGQPIYHPQKADSAEDYAKNKSKIGSLSWASNTDLDVAIFEIEDTDEIKFLQEKGVKNIHEIALPKRGQLVEKIGANSGTTSARIRSVNCSLKVWKPNGSFQVYRNQLQLYKLSVPGDSGSVLFAKDKAVGVVFGSTNNSSIENFSYANDITRVFNRKFDAEQEFYVDGKNIKIKELKIKK